MFSLKRNHKTINEILENNDSETVDIVLNLFKDIVRMDKATEIINQTCAYEIALYGNTDRAKIANFVYAKMGIN